MKNILLILSFVGIVYAITPLTGPATDTVQFNRTNKNVMPNGLNIVGNNISMTNSTIDSNLVVGEQISVGKSNSIRNAVIYFGVTTNNASFTFDNYGNLYQKAQGTNAIITIGTIANTTNDSTAAFQTALDSLNSQGGGTLYVAPGRYIVSNLTSYANITISGVLGKSILKQNPTSQYCISVNPGSGGTTNVANNATNIVFVDMTFEGQAIELGFSEHVHLMNLNAVSDVRIVRCSFIAPRGDGIYLGSGNVGSIERHNERVIIRDCLFDGVVNQNRNAVSVIDGTHIKILSCSVRRFSQIGMPGAFDFETDSVFNKLVDCTVENCNFDSVSGGYCVAFYAPSQTNYANFNSLNILNNYVGSNCSINGAAFTFLTGINITTNVYPMGLSVIGNKIFCTAPVIIARSVRGLLFQDNTIYGSSVALFGDYDSLTNAVWDATVKGNKFSQSGNSTGMLLLANVNRFDIIENIFNTPLSASAPAPILFFGNAATTTTTNVSIIRNHFIKGTSSITKSVAVTGNAQDQNTCRYYMNQNDDATLSNDFLFNVQEFREQNMFVYDSTKLPDSFTKPMELSTVNTGDTSLPDLYHQGVVITYVFSTETGFRKFIVQTFIPANNDSNSVIGFYKRVANAGSNTWGPWHFSSDLAYVSKNANYTTEVWDDVIKVDTTSVQTLPNATNFGKVITIINTGIGSLITITNRGSQLINGSASVVLTNRFDSISMIADGSQWWVLNSKYTAAGAGTITSGVNLGAGSAGPLNSISGSILQFNSFAEGSNVTITSNANVITIAVPYVDTISDGTDIIQLIGGALWPLTSGIDLGTDNTPGTFDRLYLSGSFNLFGSGAGGVDYERLVASHTGSIIQFLSSAGGTGTAEDFVFSFNDAGYSKDAVRIKRTSFQPASVSVNYDLGATTSADTFFNDIYLKGIAYIYGTGEGTGNNEYVSLTHDGVSEGILGSNKTGAGVARPMSIKVGGNSGIQVDATATAGQTRLLLYDVDNGTLERVTVGAADSGGVGYKVLRIPN